jgi:hypothetical protein
VGRQAPLAVKDFCKMIKLTDRALLAIRNDTKLKGELQACLNISSNTLYAWLRKNDQKLTSASALEAIKKSTELTDDELLTRTA